jgi:membrane-associated phospholipid phosphatase
VRKGTWGTVDASHRRERPVLYGVGGAALLALIAYLAITSPSSPLVRGAGYTLAMIAVCAAATVWIKVSLHLAVAALAAMVLLHMDSPAGWVLAALLPLLAWSRVSLGRHTWTEVALGAVIGAITGLMVVRP